MSNVILRAETGRETGTRSSRRLRSRGMVPATFYGRGSDALSVAVSARDLRSALTTEAGLNAVINLQIGEETHTSLARQLQRHPTRGDIIHLDFLKISLTDEVEAVVAIELIGDQAAIREGGGILETIANTVTVRALVTAIPESIQADISGLGVGDTLRVSDLPTPSGVEYLDDPDQPVLVVSLPAIAQTEEEDEEEVEDLVLVGEDGEGAEAGTEQEA
ncbi:MAG: 50S ribosomal protein L25 [Acidimicrobiia bacterium]|nr:50S ribosomal protein L25 [Acidimicrobiia bacterium]MYF84441.1 50S ribosomal protein L25 [Acidimicrobiia bacterium]